jgi:zinc-ribbon domain
MAGFCMRCGTPLTSETSRFCTKCGASVVTSKQSSNAQPAPGVSRKGWRTIAVLILVAVALPVIWGFIKGFIVGASQNEAANQQGLSQRSNINQAQTQRDTFDGMAVQVNKSYVRNGARYIIVTAERGNPAPLVLWCHTTLPKGNIAVENRACITPEFSVYTLTHEGTGYTLTPLGMKWGSTEATPHELFVYMVKPQAPQGVEN